MRIRKQNTLNAFPLDLGVGLFKRVTLEQIQEMKHRAGSANTSVTMDENRTLMKQQVTKQFVEVNGLLSGWRKMVRNRNMELLDIELGKQRRCDLAL